MTSTNDDGRDTGASFEVERDDQPQRDDLIDHEEVDADEVGGATMDRETGTLPDPEELPESQGVTALDAERETEDATPRRLLSDEEQERG